MLDLEPLYRLVSLLPFECLQAGFMQQALVALILLAPMAATMGVQVVSFRMAFFSDAISHSAFAGVALGLIFSINPHVAMPVFGILVGLGIMAVQRNSALSSDTIIGVFFSAVMGFRPRRGQPGQRRGPGSAAVPVRRHPDHHRNRYPLAHRPVLRAGGLSDMGLQPPVVHRLNSVVAKAHRINVFFWQYLFAGLLALVVMFSVWAVGVLLVTALLIVPAATARNLARTAGGMFWWSILVSVTSAVARGWCSPHRNGPGQPPERPLSSSPAAGSWLSAVLAAIRGEGRRQ